MKVKVIKEFVDKHTQELRTVGSSFECDADRYAEIIEAGAYVEPVKEVKEKAEKPNRKG